MDKLDSEYIAQLATTELSDAESWMNGELASEQEKNLNYYKGNAFGDVEEGFSDIVTRDVLETVEGIMPELMKLFTSSDDVVHFTPVFPGDEVRVKLESKYINHVFMNKCNGYKVLYDWFKDALLMKNGILKLGWEQCEEVQFQNFNGLNEDEFQAVMDGTTTMASDYEVDSYYEADDGYYDVRVKLVREIGKPCIEVIPMEDFRIKSRSTCIQESSFVAHVSDMTKGELLTLGYGEDDVDAGFSSIIGGVEEARFSKPAETDSKEHDVGMQEEVEVSECWMRIYCPEDEKVKLIRAFLIGRNCVEWEEQDHIPLISLAPIMMPHSHTGVAVADLVRDIQEIRTEIMREVLNNMKLQNAGRYTALEGQVNLEDLIDNKIGGIVRQKTMGAVTRLDTPDLSNYTVPVLDGLDVQKENRTGVSRLVNGLDPSALNSHQTRGAVNQVMTAAQSKILLIARNFAETGVKELFLRLYNLIKENQENATLLEVDGRFATINPPEWIDRYSVSVTVGIGNTNKDQQLFHLQNIAQLLQQIGATKYGYMITAENVFNLAAEFIENSGYDNPTQFISNPQTLEEPETQPSPEQITAMANMKKANVDEAKQKHEAAMDKANFGMAKDEHDFEKKVRAAEVSLEAEQDRPVGIGNGQ